MKILQALPFEFYGGPESQIFQLAAKLKNQYNISTELMLFYGKKIKAIDQEFVNQFAKNNFLDISWHPSPNIFNFYKTSASIQKKFNDGGFTHLVSSGYVCDLLCANVKAHKICYFHGWTGSSFKIKFYEWLDFRSLNKFDQIICVSETQKRILNKHNQNCYVLGNSLSLDQLPTQHLKSDLHSRFNLSDSAKIIISLGRLSSEKNPDLAIQIMKSPSILNQQIYWIWFGDGPELNILRKKTKILGLNNLIFAGFEPQASAWLSSAEIFILPSKTEGLPVALLEAMFLKKSIIASKVGGIPEVIQNKKTGLLCESDNAQNFVEAIELLLSDLKMATALGSEAHQFATKNYSLNNQVKKWLEFLTLR